MNAGWMIVAATLALAGPNASGADDPGSFLAEKATVEVIEEVYVAAEEAGILTEFNVKAGQQVDEGAKLGQIKDTKAQAARRLALAEAEVAKKEAENDVDARYAQKQKEVAWVIYEKNVEANKAGKKNGKGKVIPEVEILRLKLEAERADLQLEQALFKSEVAKLQHDAKLAAVAAADDDIQRRQIVAPLAGEVREVMQKRGQWVNPGDQIAHIVELRRLRIVAKVDQATWSPTEVDGREVVVSVVLKSGEVAFKGSVVFVDRMIVSNTYIVHIEVDNRKQDDHWLLLPGHSVSVSFDDGGVPAPEETADRR